MNLKERNSLPRKAWENDYNYLQIDGFAKIGEGRCTIRNCNKITFIECTPETKPFQFFVNKYDIFNKNKEELETWDEIENLQSNAKQLGLVEQFGKQDFHFNLKELFEPITKAVTDGNQKLLEETKFNTKAIMELDESNKYLKNLKPKIKKEVINSSLIRIIPKLLVPKIKSQFRLLGDPDNDNCNDYKMIGEKVTLYDKSLLFRDTGVVFTLNGGNLSMISD